MPDRNGYIGRSPSDSNITIARQTNQPTSSTSTFVFNSGYDVGYLDIYVNGSKLINALDYTATDTRNVTLTTAAVSGDVVEFVAYKAFNLSNVVSSTPGDFLVDGTVTATSFVGSGANLTDVISGVELKQSGSTVGTSITAINFSGATVSAPVSGLSTITIAQTLTLGVRTGVAVTFGLTGSTFNISNRAGGNVPINI